MAIMLTSCNGQCKQEQTTATDTAKIVTDLMMSR